MIRKASELRAAARVTLSDNWLMSALMTLVYCLIFGACGADKWLSVVQILLLPLSFGFSVAFLRLYRRVEITDIEFGWLFDGFKNYGRILGTYLLVCVYIFLWTLLLIVPGIIKWYSYAMVPYILEDNPDLKYNKAIERSMEMMNGHKADLFYLHITFLGWGLLCLLTLGWGFLWLTPYTATAQAIFYEDLKAEEEGLL